MMKKGKTRLADEAKALEVAKDKHLENAQVFQNQLAELKQSKVKGDEVLNNQVNQVLDSLPDTSAKGMIDKVLQMKTGKSAQLVENIEKISLAAQNEQRKAGIAELELRKIKNDLKELSLNENAQNAGNKIAECIVKYKEIRDYFQNDFLSEINTANMSDPKWSSRLEKQGFPRTFDIVGQSFLKPEILGSLSLEGFIEKIMNLTSYGPPLIEKDRNIQPSRQVQRDNYFGYEKPQ